MCAWLRAVTTCLEFPNARHTHQCIAIQWNLVGKVRGQGLAHDHGLVPDYGLVLEITGYLLNRLFFIIDESI